MTNFGPFVPYSRGPAIGPLSSMYNPFMGPMNPMAMMFGGPLLTPAVYPINFGVNPDPYQLILRDKLMYPDDLSQLYTPSDIPISMHPHLVAEEASNQNELNEQLASLKGLRRSEVRDFSNYIGDVIASGPFI